MEYITSKVQAVKELREYLNKKYDNGGDLATCKVLIEQVMEQQIPQRYIVAASAYKHVLESNGIFRKINLTDSTAHTAAFKAAVDAAVQLAETL